MKQALKELLPLILLFSSFSLFSQDASIKGQLTEEDGTAIIYANVLLHAATDSSLVKTAISDDAGIFSIEAIPAGDYFLQVSYVGLSDLVQTGISLSEGEFLDLEALVMSPNSVQLEEATITAKRSILEVKPDRTVFNVEGTINSTGSDGINLLRKAPGVIIDNNNNIQVLGRSGVLIYIDGKRLPLSGDELSNYLQNLQADQIDRIDIITNPGAKYEAEGNAGIIDIIMKRDKSHGFNGSANASYSIGRLPMSNAGITGNYRNKNMNVFGSLNGGVGQRFNEMDFINELNGIYQDEDVRTQTDFQNGNFRGGVDFFLGDHHTVGVLVSAGSNTSSESNFDRLELSPLSNREAIDSILVANTITDAERTSQSYNLNYAFKPGNGRSLNIDLDYGRYVNNTIQDQSNEYFNASESDVLTRVDNDFDTPSDIQISSAKIDYEQEVLGGVFGIGSKITNVFSDNTFLFYQDDSTGTSILNTRNSNDFEYNERVTAGYVNYARPINQKLNMNAGLRMEYSDILGELMPFEEDLQEDPVDLEYVSWFPNVGFTYALSPMQTLSLSYGRRINRPDYNVLNPFNYQLSQLSYSKGNPFLRPEIVNNIELGYTLFYRFNFKLGYSRTLDQITRLIAPDDVDPRAGFITWENLATQTIYSFNASLPFQIKPWWSSYFNVNMFHQNNQSDYGDGAVVDVQAFSYSFYQQQSFTLGNEWTAEVSGWYSGPGIWGGVFLYDPSFSLDLGLQKKFFQKKLNVKLSVSDIFYQSFWSGFSEFDGLYSEGSGRWDSRRFAVNLSYNFGNQQVKSRSRKTGIEAESGRVGG